jgi:hypothetical protein
MKPFVRSILLFGFLMVSSLSTMYSQSRPIPDLPFIGSLATFVRSDQAATYISNNRQMFSLNTVEKTEAGYNVRIHNGSPILQAELQYVKISDSNPTGRGRLMRVVEYGILADDPSETMFYVLMLLKPAITFNYGPMNDLEFLDRAQAVLEQMNGPSRFGTIGPATIPDEGFYVGTGIQWFGPDDEPHKYILVSIQVATTNN